MSSRKRTIIIGGFPLFWAGVMKRLFGNNYPNQKKGGGLL